MQEEHSRAGTVRIRPALTWGWAAATSNWRLWVPCTAVALLITAASLALCYYVTPLVVAALVIPFATVTALRQTRERAPRLRKMTTLLYKETLLTALLVVFVFVACFTLWSTVVAFSGRVDGFFPSGALWLGGGAIVLLNVLAPWLTQIIYYSASGMTMWDATRPGIVAGSRNYAPLLGLAVLLTLLNAAGALLAGVGLLVTLPVALLAFAHAYLQASGGQVPSNHAANPQ